MINTLKYAKRLEAAGFSRIQAEAQALAIQDAFDDSMHPFATKSDLNIAVTRLDAKIDGVEKIGRATSEHHSPAMIS